MWQIPVRPIHRMSTNIRRQIHPVESKKRKELAGSSQPSASSQQLLAGYMAYEFLTRGTLLGQELDPVRPEAVALTSSSTKRAKSEETEIFGNGVEQQVLKKRKSYAEVASLLKSDGAHLPWVVNPTQLARWVQM